MSPTNPMHTCAAALAAAVRALQLAANIGPHLRNFFQVYVEITMKAAKEQNHEEIWS